MAKRMAKRNPWLTVRQLIQELEGMPQNARVKFLDTDDADRAPCDVESVGTFEQIGDGIGPEGRELLKEAGLEPGQVVITGVTR